MGKQIIITSEFNKRILTKPVSKCALSSLDYFRFFSRVYKNIIYCSSKFKTFKIDNYGITLPLQINNENHDCSR